MRVASIFLNCEDDFLIHLAHLIARLALIAYQRITWGLRRKFKLCKKLADEQDRTVDLRFTKPLLYQLSYIGALPNYRLGLSTLPNLKGHAFTVPAWQGPFRWPS